MADLKNGLVWKEGASRLMALGLTERTAKSNLGRWLKANTPDAVLEAVLAASRKGTLDPIPFVTAALKKGERPWKREGDHYLIRGDSEHADKWRSHGKRTNQGDYAYIPKTPDYWAKVPRLYPEQRNG